MGKKERKKTELRKIAMIDIDKIIPNCEQSRTADKEAAQHLAESIRKIGLINPIEVTPRGDKYMLAGGGLDRVNAFKILGEKEIKAIIENLDDNEAAERALVDNLCRRNYTSIELEEAIYKRWVNGNYKTRRQLGELIRLSGGRIGLILNAREIRKKTNAPLVISTQVIIDSKGLDSDKDKIKLYKMVEEERLAPGQVREVVSNINGWPEEVKNAVLDGVLSYSRAKEIINSRLPLIKKLNDITIKALRNKKTWKKIFSEVDVEQVDIFLKLFIFAKELEPNHIKEIKDETEQKQVIHLIINATTLFSRLLFKLDKINKDQFEAIVKYFNLKIKDVELLKSSGHDYAFPWEWETSEEQKLSEKIRKIKSGGTVPLEEILDKTNRSPKSLGGG